MTPEEANMSNIGSIVIVEGARRTPRADILENNKDAGLFSRFSTSALSSTAAVAVPRQRSFIDAGSMMSIRSVPSS